MKCIFLIWPNKYPKMLHHELEFRLSQIWNMLVECSTFFPYQSSRRIACAHKITLCTRAHSYTHTPYSKFRGNRIGMNRKTILFNAGCIKIYFIWVGIVVRYSFWHYSYFVWKRILYKPLPFLKVLLHICVYYMYPSAATSQNRILITCKSLKVLWFA